MGWLYIIILICSFLVGLLLSTVFEPYTVFILHVVAILIMISLSIIINFEFKTYALEDNVGSYIVFFFIPIGVSYIGSLVRRRN